MASDGSTDDTVACAHKVIDPRISVLDLPRQGKAATLNAGVALSMGEILVFTDADNQWSTDTLASCSRPWPIHRSGPVPGTC